MTPVDERAERATTAGATPSAIWTPLDIGPVRVKHRIMMPPHGQTYGEKNVPSARHVTYYRERAKGGVSMLGIEQTSGHRWGKAAYATALTAWERRSIKPFARIADAVHEHGCKVTVELAGTGVTEPGRTFIDEWHAPTGASAVPSVLWNVVPAVMDHAYIRELVEDFGTSAANMREAGIDAIELHAGHGYLFSQMLSPLYNRRTDEYGGSPEKRCRLISEVAQEIRDRVGNDMALGIRLSYDEFLGDAGIVPDLSDEYVGILNATGLFDFFDISAGNYHTLHYAVAPMGSVGDGFLVPYARRAKGIVKDSAKVFVVGRIKTLAMAEEIITSGAADMVAMLRPHIADPHFVEKSRSGRGDEINHCVGGNDCIIAAFNGEMLTCTVNPIAGRERKWGQGTLRLVKQAKRVAVIGAGPAGLKTAAVAAARGHEVTVFEQADEPGGHLRQLAQLPSREDWNILISDLSRAAARTGVTVRYGEVATPALLARIGATAVVCATGSRWDATGYTVARPDRAEIDGVRGQNVLTIGDAIARAGEDPSALGARVLIIDESKAYWPVGLAEVLGRAGVSVEIVTRHLVVGEEVIASAQAGHVFPRLAALGVRFTPQTFVDAIRQGSVDISSMWGGGNETREVDTVVLSMNRSSEDSLYQELTGAETFATVLRIGDALSPRRTGTAIYEGERTGREL